MTNDSLDKAIDYLGAVEVAPGRYAFFMADRWHTASQKSVELYGAYPKRQDAIEVILYAGNTRVMPAWWKPEQRFAWRIKATGNVVPSLLEARRAFEGGFMRNWVERVTADLASGEEIPA